MDVRGNQFIAAAHQTGTAQFKANNQAMVQKAIIDLELRGGGNAAINDALKTIGELRKAAAAGVIFTIDPKKPLASLQSIEARLEGTGMSAKQAVKVMTSVFGKDVMAKFRHNLLGVPPVMNAVKSSVIQKYQQMAAGLQRKIRMGPLDASNVLATINNLYAAMLRLTGSANAAAGAVARATTQHGPSGAGGHHLALGGVISSPEFALVGEAGPEAVVPLTNPSRAAEVMNEAGLSGGGTIVNVYLDSEPVAARVEVRQAQRRRRNSRLRPVTA